MPSIFDFPKVVGVGVAAAAVSMEPWVHSLTFSLDLFVVWDLQTRTVHLMQKCRWRFSHDYVVDDIVGMSVHCFHQMMMTTSVVVVGPM